MNYKLTYNLNGVSYTIVVWDQPWTNSRVITSIQTVQNFSALPRQVNASMVTANYY
jgi:hypothetical protein